MASVDCRIPRKKPKTMDDPTNKPTVSARPKSRRSMISRSRNDFFSALLISPPPRRRRRLWLLLPSCTGEAITVFIESSESDRVSISAMAMTRCCCCCCCCPSWFFVFFCCRLNDLLACCCCCCCFSFVGSSKRNESPEKRPPGITTLTAFVRSEIRIRRVSPSLQFSGTKARYNCISFFIDGWSMAKSKQQPN